MRTLLRLLELIVVFLLSCITAAIYTGAVLYLRNYYNLSFPIPVSYLAGGVGGGGLLFFLYSRQRNEPLKTALYLVIVSILLFLLMLLVVYMVSFAGIKEIHQY